MKEFRLFLLLELLLWLYRTWSHPWFSCVIICVSVGFLILFCPHLSRWPRTLAGITAYLQCTRNTHGSGIYPGNPQDERKAWRRCDRGGFWADDDYSRCQYANDVTRVLYMFNQVTRKASDLLRRVNKTWYLNQILISFYKILVKQKDLVFILRLTDLSPEEDLVFSIGMQDPLCGVTLSFLTLPDFVPLFEYLYHLLPTRQNPNHSSHPSRKPPLGFLL